MLGYKQKRRVTKPRRWLPENPARHALRWLSGWFFIVLGIIGLFLPVLQGALFIFIGMILLAPYVPVFRRLRRKFFRRFPRARKGVRSFKKRWMPRRKRYFTVEPETADKTRGNKKGMA